MGIDLRSGEIRSVVWATGVRPDFSWLDIPVFDHRGRLHDGGVTCWPGLYVLGLPMLRDADDLAAHFIDHLAAGNPHDEGGLMNTHPLATSVATAVADRALDRLGTHLTDEIRLRALLPGGPIEEHGRDAVLARFDDWFGSYDTVVLTDVAGDDVGDRVLVYYKLKFDPDADRRVLTQTVVCTLHDGLVGRMDLVCTGFREY